MRTRWLSSLGVVLTMTACTNTSTGNPNHEGPLLGDLQASTFAVIDSGVSSCGEPGEPDASKLSPGLADLEATLGSASEEFIVTLQAEIDNDAYPLPTGRDGGSYEPEDDPVYLARARHIAGLQGCALIGVERGGGTYQHSFLLINAFSARLTAEQALSLTGEPSVRSVELSQTDIPPPN